jgi:hypothetical protein
MNPTCRLLLAQFLTNEPVLNRLTLERLIDDLDLVCREQQYAAIILELPQKYTHNGIPFDVLDSSLR